VHIRPARLIAVSVLVAAVLGAAAFSSSASAAPTGAPCWRQVINEWVKYDRVSPTYPLHCYNDAIAHVPNDLKQYSSIEEDILAARQQAARRGDKPRVLTGHSGSGQAAATPRNGLYNQAVDSLGPNNADSMPLPLLILAGLSLILIAAGGAGLVTRRVKARKVPS
jgi:hypothetical protein